MFNPYATDFIQTIFHSFVEKEVYLWKNIHLQNVIIRSTKHLLQNILAIRVQFIGLKFIENGYTRSRQHNGWFIYPNNIEPALGQRFVLIGFRLNNIQTFSQQ